MAITDKTRKILWARSGNRCAICRCELVMNKTFADPEAIVGDECHIISKQPNGPRSAKTQANTDLDGYENLILLCKTHHKLVDEQFNHFTETRLKTIKAFHEQWVHDTLEKYSKGQTIEAPIPDSQEFEDFLKVQDEIESKDVSDFEKFAMIAVEIGRRGWPIQVISFSHVTFFKWLQEQEQELGRGAVYVSLDEIGYISTKTAKDWPDGVRELIATYDMDKEYVLITELSKDSQNTAIIYRIEARLPV